MGKQILFFLETDEELSLLDDISKLTNILVNKKAEKLDDDIPRQIFIALEKSNILKTGEFINEILSEVIVFSRTDYKANNEVYHGRIWMETQFYNTEGELCKKSANINKLFKEIGVLIKNKTTKSVCGLYYISDKIRELALNKDIILKAAPKVDIEI